MYYLPMKVDFAFIGLGVSVNAVTAEASEWGFVSTEAAYELRVLRPLFTYFDKSMYGTCPTTLRCHCFLVQLYELLAMAWYTGPENPLISHSAPLSVLPVRRCGSWFSFAVQSPLVRLILRIINQKHYALCQSCRFFIDRARTLGLSSGKRNYKLYVESNSRSGRSRISLKWGANVPASVISATHLHPLGDKSFCIEKNWRFGVARDSTH